MIDATFEGNNHDLEQFARLLKSRPRSDEREQALRAWEAYKLARQAAYIRVPSDKRGAWKKGEYIRSLTAPAIDLRGATLKDVCLGYADLRGVRFDGAQFLPDRRAWVALKGCRLERASLVGVYAPGARLMDAHLAEADLRGADLSGAERT